jgi:hypothetical protein
LIHKFRLTAKTAKKNNINHKKSKHGACKAPNRIEQGAKSVQICEFHINSDSLGGLGGLGGSFFYKSCPL